MDVLKQLKDRVVAHATLPKPEKVMVDIERIEIKNSQKLLILVKDNSQIRQRE